MPSNLSLAGSVEDVAAFGEQLTHLYNLDPPIYILGSIGRLAIDAAHGGQHIGSLEARKPWPAEKLAFELATSRRNWWRRTPTPPPRVMWRDIDVAAPFAESFYKTYGNPSLHDIPIDLHLQGFFRAIEGRAYWTPTKKEMIALSGLALRPFTRYLNGNPVRTFSAAVQEWMEVRFAQRYRFNSRDHEPSYKGFAALMAGLRSDPESHRAELELPAELAPHERNTAGGDP